MWLWRAGDDEGEVLDVLVQKRRNKHAAPKLLRKLLRAQGVHPETSRRTSYSYTARRSGISAWPRPTAPVECVRTTGLRTPTWRSADGNGGHRSSSRRPPPNGCDRRGLIIGRGGASQARAANLTIPTSLHRHCDVLTTEYRLPVLDLADHDVVGGVGQFGDAGIGEATVGRGKEQVDTPGDRFELLGGHV